MNRVILTFICLLLFSSFISYADYNDFYSDYSTYFDVFEDPNTGLTIFPTLLIPLGGRLEGMGTAFTAMAIDSGYIESNPAGGSMLPHNELSLYHHGWIDDSNLEGVVYTSRINDLGLAACGKFLYVPFPKTNDYGFTVEEGVISETVGILNISYNFLSSYYFSGIAVGMNLKGAFRNVPEKIYPDQSIAAGMVDFGLLTRFNFLKFFNSRTRNFSIGLAVKNLGVKSVEEPLPSMFSGGIAYSFIKPVTLAVDFNLPFTLDSDTPHEHWDIATGTNIVITDFISMQAGFRIKENPRAALGCTVDMQDFSIVTNYNVDLSGSFNPFKKFSVEIKIKIGHEESRIKQKQVDDLFAQGLEEFARGNFLKAIELWEKALEIDPKFLPALEYINTTKEYLELQNEMEEKQENIEEEE